MNSDEINPQYSLNKIMYKNADINVHIYKNFGTKIPFRHFSEHLAFTICKSLNNISSKQRQPINEIYYAKNNEWRDIYPVRR
jgi:hypothetical protein